MNGKTMHWVNRLAALGLVVGFVAGLAAAGSAQSVGGQAYSTYVNTPLGSSAQSPMAVLPAVSGTDGAEADAEGGAMRERESGVEGKSVDLGGWRIIKKKKERRDACVTREESDPAGERTDE